MADKNLNNKGLAALLSVSPSTVGNWLDGTKPDGDKIVKLAELGRERPERLFAVIYGVPLAETDDDRARELTREFVDLLWNRSEVEQQAAIAALRGFFDTLDKGDREKSRRGDLEDVAR